jgi:hypothetical protein
MLFRWKQLESETYLIKKAELEKMNSDSSYLGFSRGQERGRGERENDVNWLID